jgi:VWFA-related protein
MKDIRKTLILIAAAILFLSAGFAGLGQEHDRDSPSPRKSGRQEKITDQESREVDVRLVLLDVIATKDGEFFPGLKKSDFRIFEDGREVQVNSCDLVSLGKSDLKLGEGAEGTEDAPPAIVRKRRLAVLFDGLNANKHRDFKKAAKQVSGELVELAKNDTEVMVLYLDTAHGLRMIQPFTDQEALIRNAAGKASANTFSPFLELKDYDGILLSARYMEEGGAGGDAGAQAAIEARALEYTNGAADNLTRTVGALLASIHMLESLPGRKNLLFVSGGIPDVDSFAIEQGLPLKRRPLRVFDPFGILGKKVLWTGEDVLKAIIRVANDRNISIYSLDPDVFSKYLSPGASAENFGPEDPSSKEIANQKYLQLQNLQMLSDKTGAELLRGSKKFEFLRQIVSNELNSYYQLSYYPPRRKADKAYHQVEVKLNGRRDVRVKTREGYSDSFVAQSLRVRLAQAFYNPDLFLDLVPFEAGFIPFVADSGIIQPWMSLALPAREFFDPWAGAGEKAFEFHFWIKGRDEAGRILTGQVTLPFKMDDAFKARLSTTDFLRYYYVGPGIELKNEGNRVIFALFDPETGEIGTWTADCPPPIRKGVVEPGFINCVPGYAVAHSIDRKESFLLNRADGSLECGRIKFFPKAAGGFAPMENVHVFFQAQCLQGSPGEALFELADQSGQSREIKGTPAAESWNGNSKVWSAVYKLDLKDTDPGEYWLEIVLPSTAGMPGLNKEIRMVLGSDQDE